MAGLVCLTMAAICAVISRILLLIAALDISMWWAVGVFLPFGPTLFRLNYPEAARSSFMFRVGTLACIFLYVVLGPGALIFPHPKPALGSSKPARRGYASELVAKIFVIKQPTGKSDPVSLEERRLANVRELERLSRWNDALRSRKRDLLKSDVAGNQAYNIDLQEYMNALATATAEKQVLAKAPGK